MSIERAIRIMAGFFVMLSLALGVEAARSSSASGSWPSPPSSAPTLPVGLHRLLPAQLLLRKLGFKEEGTVCLR